MKKLYIGIVAFIYMAVSTGIALELHFCMGESAGIELYGSSSDACGKCGMTEDDTGCCHDEFQFYKISDSHKTVTNNLSFTAPSFAVITEFNIYDWQMPEITAATAVNNHSPPDYIEPPARIMHGVFRI